MDKDIETMVAEIEARAEKATPGPWKPKVVSSCYGTNGVSAGSCEDVVGMHGASAANCDFIAHAREDVPTLCAMWREAIAERDALRERLAKLESATRSALHWLGPEYFDDGKPLENLGRLVNIKS